MRREPYEGRDADLRAGGTEEQAPELGKFLVGMRSKSGTWRMLLFVALGALLAINVVLRPEHPHVAAEAIPGFWAVFGLGVSIAMGLVMKTVVAEIIGVDEDFYDAK